MNLNDCHLKLGCIFRYGLAILLFAFALAARLLILPVEAGYAFIHFYPLIVVTFYLCNIGPGIFVVLLCAIFANYIFIPPYWVFSLKSDGLLPLFIFVFSASLIGSIVSRMQYYQNALNLSEQRYSAILDDQTEFICRFKTNGVILYVNEAFCRFFGKSAETLIGTSWRPNAFEDDLELIHEKLNTLSPLNPVVTIENRVVTADGNIRWCQFINHAFFDDEGNLLEMQSVGRDITESIKLQNKLKQLTDDQQAMLDNEIVGIVKIRDRRIVWINSAIETIFGYKREELKGQLSRILYPDDAAYEAFGNAAYPILNSGTPYRAQIELVKKDNEKIWVDLSGEKLFTRNDESLWMMLDITFIKTHQHEVEDIAYHDILTGLPNRLLVADRLKQGLAQAERANQLLAVCYLDLDDFKPVNDQYGHAAGDKLLIEIARRMQKSVRANDTVSRFGGDEFVLLLTNLETVEEYHLVLNRVINEINSPFLIDSSSEVSVGASIGVTLFPNDSDDPDILLRHSDQAMYQAKKLGRNRICQYSDNS